MWTILTDIFKPKNPHKSLSPFNEEFRRSYKRVWINGIKEFSY